MTASAKRAPVITIDGPAGAGKGTVARVLARRLGYRLIDTGAMYRALAVSLKRAGVAVDDDTTLEGHLRNTDVAIVDGRVYLDGHEVTNEIRTQEISQLTSRIAALGPVRDKVTPLQRQAAEGGGVVLEGRDTGTVVCPGAEIKFFLTASLDARARRRHAELMAQEVSVTLEEVRNEVAARDAQDASRALAPLRKADDAIEVDTTELTIDQAVESMLGTIARRSESLTCCTRS